MNQSAAQRILNHLRSQQQDMVECLSASARIETPSADAKAQLLAFEFFREKLQKIGFRCRHLVGNQSGGCLVAMAPRTSHTVARQMLLGHCDTVWPHGTLNEMPVESRQGRLHGPGVYDMKAGLVQAMYAVGALYELGMEPAVQPVFLINSDEEVGSADSKAVIKGFAKVCDRVLVMEPSLGASGKIKTARKGVGRFTVKVTGVAAHSGLDPGKGRSAILELSHVIQALDALNDHPRGITVNVGVIEGGVQPNVVARESRALVDVRVPDSESAAKVIQAIDAIKPTVKGTQVSIEGGINRPPMERTPGNCRLWERAEAAADALGIEIDHGAAGGGSDGNFTSVTTPTLDGLGAVGDGAHASHEHVVEDQMPVRSALLACLISGGPISDSDPS